MENEWENFENEIIIEVIILFFHDDYFTLEPWIIINLQLNRINRNNEIKNVKLQKRRRNNCLK
jgi:hypothetical protein